MIQIEKNTVEVFKTNVASEKEASLLRRALLLHYPDCMINFDLSDCDKILRMEGLDIDPYEVEELAKRQGHKVTVLLD